MIPWGRGGIAALAAAAALLAVTGCASASIAERSYPGLPDGAAPPIIVPPEPGAMGLPDPDFGPRVQWTTEPGLLAISLWGSSSCPTEPTGLHELRRDRVEITLDRRDSPFGVCTADLAVVTHEVRVPGAESLNGELTVVVDDREFAVGGRPGR
jgi:hypothetical protein